MNDIKCGLYRHYRGGIYQVIGVAQHTEKNEKLVIYVSLDASLPGLRMRARPLTGPDGFWTPTESGGPRFSYIVQEED